MIGVVGFFIYGRENIRLFSSTNSKFSQNLVEIELFTYCSLDIVDEKYSKSNEFYLGHLFSDQKYKSFGFVTNTGVRMILVLDAASAVSPKDQEIRLIFKRFHGYYCNSISNPFYEIGSPLKSKWLDDGVKDLYSVAE